MNKKEMEKSGIYILLINIIISLFLLTSEGEILVYWITALISNVIAIIFNIYAINISKKKITNIICLVLNIAVLILLIIYGIINII